MAALAEKYLPEEHLIARGMVTYALAVTHFAADDMERSSQASLEMLKIGKKLDRLLMIVTALCDLASTKKVMGQLHLAEEYYERAYRWMVKKNGLDSRVRSAYEAGLADLMYQMNRLDQAHEHALTAIAYCRRFNVPSEQVSGIISLMRVLQVKGNTEGALSALRDAEQLMQSYQLRLSTKIELKASRVAQWLAVGDTVTASRWAETLDGGSELEQLALARLRLAQGNPAGAYDLLVRQRAAAEAGGRTGRLIAILSLIALALEAQGLHDQADEILFQVLSLARPEGHVRPFLDLGRPFYELLERYAEQGERADTQGWGMMRLTTGYGRVLLKSFQEDRKLLWGTDPTTDPAPLPPSLAGGMRDPLTDRELEVLQLLAEGHTNNEIAGRLIVAPSTIKQHLKNIYSKLDVHNRTQAVIRGRELGLL
jgi:LuxR family maltose regulon positive regulatory protein